MYKLDIENSEINLKVVDITLPVVTKDMYEVYDVPYPAITKPKYSPFTIEFDMQENVTNWNYFREWMETDERKNVKVEYNDYQFEFKGCFPIELTSSYHYDESFFVTFRFEYFELFPLVRLGPSK